MKRIIFLIFLAFPFGVSGVDLINESFEVSYPPAGWRQTTTERTNTYAKTGTYSARIQANGDSIITPLLTHPLSLSYWMLATAGAASFIVEYSNAGSTGWTALPGTPVTTDYAGTFKQEVFDLSAHQNIFVKFRRNSAKTYYLDDVVVSSNASGPSESLTLTGLGVSNSILRASSAGNTVLAFNLFSSSNARTLTKAIVTNAGNLDPINITSMELYLDADNSRTLTAADVYAAELRSDQNGKWTNANISFPSNLDSPSGRNFILTISLASMISNGASFLAGIPVGGLSASSGVDTPTSISASSVSYTAPSLMVVLNEIAWSGTAASASDEWIELYNNSSSPVSLNGWRISADDGIPFFGLTNTIDGGSFYLIERKKDTVVSDIPADLITNFGTGLGNAGENLKLFDSAGRLVDFIDCQSGWYAGTASPNYSTMSRKHPGIESSSTNWASNDGIWRNGLDSLSAPLNGTPRSPNDPPDEFTFTPGTNLFSIFPLYTVKLYSVDLPVLAFHYKHLQSIPLTGLVISNLGDMPVDELRLYLDGDVPGRCDATDPLLGILRPNGNGVFTNFGFSLASGTDALVVFDIVTTNGLDNKTFQACLPAGRSLCASGRTNSSALTNPTAFIVHIDHTSFILHSLADHTNFPGEQLVPVAAFSLSNDQPGKRMTLFSISNAGTILTPDWPSMKVWLDADSDSLVTPGVDSLLGRMTNAGGVPWAFSLDNPGGPCWTSLLTNEPVIGQTWKRVLVTADIPLNTQTNRSFIAVIRPDAVRVLGVGNAPGIPVVSGSVILSKQNDVLSFTGNTIPSLTMQVGPGPACLAFSLRSSGINVFLSSMILTNMGSLADARINSLQLFRKVSGPVTVFSAGDQEIGTFTNTASSPRRWDLKLTSSADLSSGNTATNFVVVLGTRMDFTNTLSVNFGIKSDRITSSGTGTAPSGFYTNAGFYKVTNARPSAPQGFSCVSTNASGASLRWSRVTNISDFGRFVLQYGTNAAWLTNRIYRTDASLTNTVLSGLSAGRNWFVRLRIQDSAGQSSTNQSSLRIMTRSDTNAPVFDPTSLRVLRVNKSLVHLSWSPAADAENSGPLTYLLYVKSADGLFDTNAPLFRTTATNFSFSRDMGDWDVVIRSHDSWSNYSAFVASAAVRVTVAGAADDLDDVYFYPNPVSQGDVINFNYYTGVSEILIYTVRGDLVLQTKDKTFTLPENLAAGVYYVVIRDADIRKKKRLIYLK
jgi:hypothetical protein